MSPAHRMASAAMDSVLTVDARKMHLQGRLEHFVIDTMIAKILLEHVVSGLFKTSFCSLSLREVCHRFKRTNKETRKGTNEQTSEQTKKQTNEQTNERTSGQRETETNK